jgi:hypothetical protein
MCTNGGRHYAVSLNSEEIPINPEEIQKSGGPELGGDGIQSRRSTWQIGKVYLRDSRNLEGLTEEQKSGAGEASRRGGGASKLP